MRTGLIITASLAAVLGSANAADSAFTTEEAARCGAVFARIVEAMKTAPDVPEDTRTAALIGLTFWEYELSASAPDDEAKIRAAVTGALDRLEGEMPNGEDQASARGAFLMERASACSNEIDAAYPSGEHPVLAQLRAGALESRSSAVPEEKQDRPGLR